MLRIEIEREADGRWIGEVPDLPGVLAYGATEGEARVKTTALALRVIADRIAPHAVAARLARFMVRPFGQSQLAR